MSFRDRLEKALNKEFEKKTTSFQTFGGFELGISEIPKISEKRGADYVTWGEKNDYPQSIRRLKYGSGIHNAIITTAADLIAGDGFLFNGAKTLEESLLAYNAIPTTEKTLLDQFLKNPHGDQTLDEIHKDIALDCKEIGGFCLEVVFNTTFDKISTVKYVNIDNVRACKMVDGKVESYLYSRDWSSCRGENKPREIVVFDPKREKQEHTNQLIYVKRGKLDYYPEPDYIGCLTWVQTDYQMGIFHLANIENGMNPSLWWRFYKKPGSENEQQLILDDLRRNYKGSGKAGKHVVTFSDGKELAPDITPINVSNLDKQQIVLSQLCDQKILTGHKLTSPLLAGISTPGKMGGDTEMEKSFNIYDKSRMKPYRNMIVKTYQKILDFNKVGVKLDINPFNPFV